MTAISQFKVRSRVVHFVYGGGTVVLRETDPVRRSVTVGIRWDTGLQGAYGSAFWDRWPDLIKLDDAPPTAADLPFTEIGPMEDQDALSIEDRVHLDVTGHLPEDF